VFHRIPSRFATFLAATFLVACATAHALEHITLTNGFSYDCSRHEPIDGNQIRLFLFTTNNSQSTNYIDRPITAISSIDILPDPPKPVVETPAPKLAAAPTIHDMLSTAGQQHNIDVDLLASVVHAESNYRVDATSRAGARGLMQLMPATAHDLGVTDITRPDQNINGGTAYLDSLLKLYHDDLQLALAAYNAGPAAVARYHGIPPFHETRAYVARVLREFNKRKAVLATATISSR